MFIRAKLYLDGPRTGEPWRQLLLFVGLTKYSLSLPFCHYSSFTHVIVHFGLGWILSFPSADLGGDLLSVSIPDLIRNLGSEGGWVSL